MATKQAKPNGQFHLQVENVEDYFSKIEISDLPGVGYSTTQKCMNLDLKTCADLQRMPLVKLQQEFGKKLGETLHQNCRGIDNKPLTYDQVFFLFDHITMTMLNLVLFVYRLSNSRYENQFQLK